MNRLLTRTHFSRKFINRRYMKSALKYNNEKTRWVACFFGEMDPLKQAIKLDDLFPLVEKPFEDIMVKVPKNNDVFLKRMFPVNLYQVLHTYLCISLYISYTRLERIEKDNEPE